MRIETVDRQQVHMPLPVQPTLYLYGEGNIELL